MVSWVDKMEAFNVHQIPRQFVPKLARPKSYRLHIFGDASLIAYAAVAYLESRYDDKSSAFTLIISRSRLAPLDRQTLPRLVLMAAPIAVRLMFLCERMETGFTQVRFYTESMITYCWVTSENPGSFKTFVCNRVREILNTRSVRFKNIAGKFRNRRSFAGQSQFL